MSFPYNANIIIFALLQSPPRGFVVEGAPAKETLSPAQWKDIFTEAASLGINFSLLAGGEPLTRRDILESVAEMERIMDTRKSTYSDILFLGAGVFLGKVNKSVQAFIDGLNPAKVKCVVLFGSSAIIDSPVPQMCQWLAQKGIAVAEKSFSCKGSMGPVHAGHPNADDLAALEAFAKGIIGG